MDFFGLSNILKDNKCTSKNMTGFLVFGGDFITTNINVNLTSIMIASLSLK